MEIGVQHRLINVKEYYRMAEANILTKDDRVELINGEIFEMSPIGSKHAYIVDRISNLIKEAIGNKVIVRVQNPVYIDEMSEPEPDISIIDKTGNYIENHPKAIDTYLLIEVSDNTLRYDQDIKLPLYASAEFEDYWIVDLVQKRIISHNAPSGKSYLIRTVFEIGETIEFVPPFKNFKFSVSELFGELS